MALEEELAAVVARVVAPLVDELRGLREEVHRLRSDDAPALLATADAARLVGAPSCAALRMRAQRDPAVAGARRGRMWSREELLAAAAAPSRRR